MKALKIARAVLLIVAVTLVGLGVVISATAEEGGALILFLQTYVTTLGTGIAFALLVLGTALLMSKSGIASKVGMALSVSIYLALSLPMLMGSEGTDSMLAFVAAIVFAVSWLIHLLYIVSVRAAKQ